MVQPDQLDLLVDDSALYKGAALRSAATFTAADACDCKVPAAIPPLPQAESMAALPQETQAAPKYSHAPSRYTRNEGSPPLNRFRPAPLPSHL